MSEWISVKDRVPEDDQAVLMMDEELNNSLPTIGWYEAGSDGTGFFTADHCLRMRLIVTHWTPIPKFGNNW